MGQSLSNEYLKTNIVAFINSINQNYYTGVLDESLPFSCDDILVDAINKMVEKIIKGILNNKQSYPILESNNILSFETLTALLYILARPSNFEIKKIMCVWLYKLLFELYELKTDDNKLYKAIITFLLVNNRHIFLTY